MTVLGCTSKYCIIGAGSSGITAAKNLKQVGFSFAVFEREDGIGGNWYYGKAHSSVYRSIHLISSKPLTEYTDYPMPKAGVVDLFARRFALDGKHDFAAEEAKQALLS